MVIDRSGIKAFAFNSIGKIAWLTFVGGVYLMCCIVDPDPEKTKREKEIKKKKEEYQWIF